MAVYRLALEIMLVRYMPPNVTDSRTVASRNECVQACFYEKVCATILYREANGECLFYRGRASQHEAALYSYDAGLQMINTDRQACPSERGYIYAEPVNACHKYHSTPARRQQAYEKCIEEGAHGLLMVNSMERLQYFASRYYGPSLGAPFVDGQLVAGTWLYRDGSSMVPGEIWYPDNPSVDGPCVNLYAPGINDVNCHHEYPFICEINY